MNFTHMVKALGYVPKAYKIYTDTDEAVDQWIAMGGFNASTEAIVNYLGDQVVKLIGYTTWTAITWDDDAANVLRCIVIDHRYTLIQIINLVRNGKEPDMNELANIAGQIVVNFENARQTSAIDSSSVASPMQALTVLSMLFQVLQYLKTLKQDNDTNVTPQPNQDTQRPVLAFVRQLFGRAQHAR